VSVSGHQKETWNCIGMEMAQEMVLLEMKELVVVAVILLERMMLVELDRFVGKIVVVGNQMNGIVNESARCGWMGLMSVVALDVKKKKLGNCLLIFVSHSRLDVVSDIFVEEIVSWSFVPLGKQQKNQQQKFLEFVETESSSLLLD